MKGAAGAGGRAALIGMAAGLVTGGDYNDFGSQINPRTGLPFSYDEKAGVVTPKGNRFTYGATEKDSRFKLTSGAYAEGPKKASATSQMFDEISKLVAPKYADAIKALGSGEGMSGAIGGQLAALLGGETISSSSAVASNGDLIIRKTERIPAFTGAAMPYLEIPSPRIVLAAKSVSLEGS